MHRLTLSDADKQARDWFVRTTESLGCKVKIDAMGRLPFPFAPWSDTEMVEEIFLL